MDKKVIIVHQWSSNPNKDWYPWAKIELEKKGFQVIIPEMPDTNYPIIKNWVGKLADVAGIIDENTILVGHSIGCQTILRFLEQTSDHTRVDRVILVAPWFRLTPTATTTDEEKGIARPWLKEPLDFEKVKTKASEFVAIFSDDDYFVPIEPNQQLFKEKLGAKIVIVKGKKHFSEEDGVTSLPILLNTI